MKVETWVTGLTAAVAAVALLAAGWALHEGSKLRTERNAWKELADTFRNQTGRAMTELDRCLLLAEELHHRQQIPEPLIRAAPR